MNINWNLGATVASADDPQSAVEDLQGTDLLDPRTIDRAFIADTIYRDCNGEKAPILPGGEAAHPLSTPERNEFCRCVGDYLSELLSDAEIHHVATYLAATPDMLDKEQRAKETCAMFAP